MDDDVTDVLIAVYFRQLTYIPQIKSHVWLIWVIWVKYNTSQCQLIPIDNVGSKTERVKGGTMRRSGTERGKNGEGKSLTGKQKRKHRVISKGRKGVFA